MSVLLRLDVPTRYPVLMLTLRPVSAGLEWGLGLSNVLPGDASPVWPRTALEY